LELSNDISPDEGKHDGQVLLATETIQ
jgi:hypothetical protein